MKQLLLPSDYVDANHIRITGDDYHYLRNVLRFGEGDRITGRDHRGVSYRLTVEKAKPGELILRVIGEDPGVVSRQLISLLQCIPKGSRMDRIVRQVTEMGVDRIIPLVSEHTVVRLDEQMRMLNRLERWRRVAREALQQSGGTKFPEILQPRRLCEVEVGSDGCHIMFHPINGARANLHSILAGRPSSIDLLIGPEGGFSDKEVDRLTHLGFQSVMLGSNILRVETAAVYAVAAVSNLIREYDSWTEK